MKVSLAVTHMKRREAVEPVIGHMKHDHRMSRCHLIGSLGDAIHAIACAAGCNIRWLTRAVLRLGLQGLFAPLNPWPWVTLAERWGAYREGTRRLIAFAASLVSKHHSHRGGSMQFEFCRDDQSKRWADRPAF